MPDFLISGLLTDVFSEKIYAAMVEVRNGKIFSIKELEKDAKVESRYIIPGFIDSHVHIESSMLVPSEFARIAVMHGTVATVSDPHEIANVCGSEGVDFMIANGNTVPFKFYFGAPSCVPATIFETAGAALSAEEVDALLQNDDIKYLSEMMNFPGVLSDDPEVLLKINSAFKQDKPVDGHAPGLSGHDLKRYIDAGISTDHECFTAHEALEKLQHGMNIIIREGSAAKNFEALIELLHDYPDMIMFCSDDKHPDSLVAGHINVLCSRAIAKGIDIFKVLKAACINPVLHYKLDVGLLRIGDPADFVVVSNLCEFSVLQTFINGELVAENGKSKICQPVLTPSTSPINKFECNLKTDEDFKFLWPITNSDFINVIGAIDGQLITEKISVKPRIQDGYVVSDLENDILKIVVVNRYNRTAPKVAKAFIKYFGLKEGAIASSVAHDSHNIVAVGVDDTSLRKAVNLVITSKGGISCVSNTTEMIVELPVGGLMSDQDGYAVAEAYTSIDAMAKSIGSTLSAPFMTLSFMALLVIPPMKCSLLLERRFRNLCSLFRIL